MGPLGIWNVVNDGELGDRKNWEFSLLKPCLFADIGDSTTQLYMDGRIPMNQSA